MEVMLIDFVGKEFCEILAASDEPYCGRAIRPLKQLRLSTWCNPNIRATYLHGCMEHVTEGTVMNTKSFCGRTTRTVVSVVVSRIATTHALAIAAILVNSTRVRAGNVAPFGELTGNFLVPTNGTIYDAPSLPPLPSTPVQSVSPSPTNSFQALDDNNTSIPPDTDGAVGPNHVMTMLNTQVRIQNRTGTTNYSTVALSSW